MILDKTLKEMRMIYHALDHPLRTKILTVIESFNDKDFPVNEIYNRLRIEQSICSQHLKILKRVGIVFETREGKNRFYKINWDLLDTFNEGHKEFLKDLKKHR